MTIKTQNNKLSWTVLPAIVILFVATVAFVPVQSAEAVCSASSHCYAFAQTTVTNLGGYAGIDINSSNSVDSGTGIANPVWVGFGASNSGEFLESGWQKGTGINPCVSSTAKFYVWNSIPSTATGSCQGSVSGSTVTIQVSDSNEDGYWGLLINGVQKLTVFHEERASRVTSGGESTDADNVLDNGQTASLQYANTAGTWNSWSSASKFDDSPYTATWNTSPTDLAYEGP